MRKGFLSRRIVFSFVLLLVIVAIDALFVRPVYSELDTLEHFVFGFVLAEISSQAAISIGLAQYLRRRISRGTERQIDLAVRLAGFLVVGGLVWESLEYFVFPAFGVPRNPFFALPITLQNIDGTIDVVVGVLGCLLAWSSSRPSAL